MSSWSFPWLLLATAGLAVAAYAFLFTCVI
jgi:hypothetical protein